MRPFPVSSFHGSRPVSFTFGRYERSGLDAGGSVA